MDLITVIYIANLLLALAIIFLERRSPNNVIFWIMALFLLPGVGFFLYIVFGRRPHRWNRRVLRFEEKERGYARSLSAAGIPGTLEEGADRSRGLLKEQEPLVRLLQDGGAMLTGGNSVRLITEGPEMYDLLFEDVRRAKDHIHLEYYVFHDDAVGNELLSILIAKAEEGVKVRLLIDDVGARPSPMMLIELKARGGQYARFYPSHIPGLRWLNLNINYRNHRKIAVIDGQIGYIGGFNVGEEYIGKDPELGHWRDTHMRVEGRGVQSLQRRFLVDWSYSSGEDSISNQSYFPRGDSPGEVAMQVVSSGPTERADQVKEAYLKLIASARVSIRIQTPYFVPDRSVIDMLSIAARSGVDVRIMVPRRKDVPMVHWVSQSYVGEMLVSGVRAYYYENGFLHAKTIIVDGVVTSIGSANWDIRGFSLNFETNAVIYSDEVGKEHETIFLRDMESCTELTKEAYDHRPLSERIKESVFRLAAPLL
ncbi:MAG: cardiolipin synthase [Methanomassiliicoccus sp.]|nr:cardiolipin synthase [Methanomassiliicoccus sp.]